MFVDVLKCIRDAVFTIIMIPLMIVTFAILVVLSIIMVLFGYISVNSFWAWCKNVVNYSTESSEDYLEY